MYCAAKLSADRRRGNKRVLILIFLLLLELFSTKYQTEAKLSKDTTFKKLGEEIIYDELFLSKSGYKFNMISKSY